MEIMKAGDSDYILKVEQTGSPDALGVQCKRKRKGTGDTFSGLNNLLGGCPH